MIESIPPEVRLLCWDYLSVRDYGSLAMTCHALQDDRRHLNATRFVCIASPTNEEALQRSHVLHQKNPILLRLETPLPLQHVPLPNVTELELATRVPVVLSAMSFPNVKTITLLHHNTRFPDQQQQIMMFQTIIETLIIQDNNHFYLNGHDLRGCKALHTLVLRDCRLQLTEESDARCKSDFLSWIKAPLRNVTIRNVICPSQAISQAMLMNFVRRRPQLHYFESDDLTEANKQRLRNEFPDMEIV